MFSQASVILFTRGGVWQIPPRADSPTPPDSPSPGRHPLDRHPCWANTPRKTPPGQTPPGQTLPRQTPLLDRHLPGQSIPLGRHPRGQIPPSADNPRADTPIPQQTATAADSTHPTGMHSFFFNYNCPPIQTRNTKLKV